MKWIYQNPFKFKNSECLSQKVGKELRLNTSDPKEYTTMSQRKSQSSWDCVSNNELKFFLLKNQMYNNDNASSKIIWTHYVKWREASNGQLSWKKLEFKMHDDHSLDLEYHHFQIEGNFKSGSSKFLHMILKLKTPPFRRFVT